MYNLIPKYLQCFREILQVRNKFNACVKEFYRMCRRNIDIASLFPKRAVRFSEKGKAFAQKRTFDSEKRERRFRQRQAGTK